MIIPKEVECRTCSQVFCCAKCLQRHEDGNHQEAAMIRKICYICNGRPFPVRKDTKITANNLLIAHILKEHLPLRCNRCTKVFYCLKDLQDVKKCFIFCPGEEPSKESECHLESSKTVRAVALPVIVDEENKENFGRNEFSTDEKGTKYEGQAIPVNVVGRRKSSLLPGDLQDSKIEEVDEALLTPLSKINLRWKRKSRQSFESMLSMTNNTSEERVDAGNGNPGEGANNRRKLVRTTSTPMYQWQIMPSIMALKQSNESYSATMGQMSSIHCSSSSEADSRSDDIASSPQPAPAPPPPPSMPYELDKVRAAIIRTNRSKAAATPLRQVMSKSIQRAIAQHTGAYSKMLQPGTQRKMSFNSTMSSGMNSMIASPVQAPLDLRTTPVLKRIESISSNGSDRARQHVAQLLVPTTTVDGERFHQEANSSTERSEYYETHRDLESLRAADDETAERENQDNLRKLQEHEKSHGVLPQSYPNTPKPAGTVLKKMISFHGLDQSAYPGTKQPVQQEESMDADDVWGTPCSGVPARSYSCSAIGLGDTFKAYDASVEDADENDTMSDEVFYPPNSQRTKKIVKESESKTKKKGEAKADGTGGMGLWSIVSNVIRLASRADIQEELSGRSKRNVVAPDAGGGGLVQRAASFAGYLKNRYKRGDAVPARSSSSGSDEYRISLEANGKKRRRAGTVYSPTFAPATMAIPMGAKMQCNSPVAKRKRIQGRQPINRLRNTHSDSGSGSSSQY